MVKSSVWLLLFAPLVAIASPDRDAPTATADATADFTYGRAVVTGTVEGITEYLPISSTGHMIVSDRLLGVPKDPARLYAGIVDRQGRLVSQARIADDYLVIIQLGAILAVLFAFAGRLAGLLRGLSQGEPAARGLALAIVIAFLPAAGLGFLLKEAIAEALFSIEVVALALVVGGVVILVAEATLRLKPAAGDELGSIGLRQALTIGVCQCFALIPGTSRSLATILGGRLVGLSHAAATEFSFLVGLLTLTAASVYKMWSLGPALTQVYPAGPALLGLAIAAVTAFLSVKWLVGYVSRHGLGVFAWYRIALGGGILAYLVWA